MIRILFMLTLLTGWLLSFCQVTTADNPNIRVGSKNFTEGIVLGDLLTHVARASGADVDHKSALGGTQIVFQALEKGDIDLYVEYTGTLTQEILKGERVRSLDQLREELAVKGISMSEPLGFNNTYAMGMKEELAAKLNLTKISDLATRSAEPEIAKLQFGFSDEFMRRGDGWPTIKALYGLTQTPRGLDHSLAYRGLESGTLHISDLYSTDAEVKYYKLRLLEDDRGAFPAYKGLILYRTDLAQRAPDLIAALRKLEGNISNEQMTEMNARVRFDNEPERTVAADFLNRNFQMNIDTGNAAEWRRLIGDLWRTTLQHLLLVFVSLGAAICVALPLGVASYKWPPLTQPILGLVGMVQTIPSMAVLVFMIPLLGLGWRPAAMALFLYSLLPIVRNTYNGLAEIPPGLKESALVLGLDSRARLWWVELPMASRSILAGIKTAAVINVGTATIGGLIGAGGYGEPILTGIRLANVGMLLQGAVPAAIMALAVQAMFDQLERFVVPRGLRLAKE